MSVNHKVVMSAMSDELSEMMAATCQIEGGN